MPNVFVMPPVTGSTYQPDFSPPPPPMKLIPLNPDELNRVWPNVHCHMVEVALRKELCELKERHIELLRAHLALLDEKAGTA